MRPRFSIRAIAVSLFRGIRDLWLMIGILLAMVLVLETCYRGQAAIRKTLSSVFSTSTVLPTPYPDTTFYPRLSAEENGSGRLVWEPYVYWKRPPYSGEFMNIDERRHRVTVHPKAAGRRRTRVFMFGGSTMFGSGQRDGMTIASCVAAVATPESSFEVTNFGQTGYVFTQGVIQLALELRAGNIPDIVVFYDGINDVMAAIQNGKAGIPQNESQRATDFAFGRVVFNWQRNVLSDLNVLGALAATGAGRLQLPSRLSSFVVRPAVDGVSTSDLVDEIVENHVATARLVEALAAEYGFRALYIWQPALPGTSKPLSPYEQMLLNGMKGVPFQERRAEFHREIPSRLTPAMLDMVGDRFVNLFGVFDSDTAAVYIDQIGHTNEYAVPRIVQGFWTQFASIAGRGNETFSPAPGYCGRPASGP